MQSHILVIDIGTSSLRAALVDSNGVIVDAQRTPQPPSTPFPGLVEFDPSSMYRAAVGTARRVVDRNAHRHIAGIGIANQRASTVAWDADTGEPIAPGLGWQDLRTVGECMAAHAEHGIRFAPNQTATKAGWILSNAPTTNSSHKHGNVLVGTIDTWLVWKLTNGTAHVTDHTNAAVTGLVNIDGLSWNEHACRIAGVPVDCLPRLVASSSIIHHVHGHGILDGLPIAGLVGDQQASLVGQGCISPGAAKITFGTGGMLDMYTGRSGPVVAERTTHGTFPIVAFSLERQGRCELHWGVEAIMLSAGTNIEWLCDDMGLVSSPAESDSVAASVPTSAGVVYVPALLGLGTPAWDYGARGTITGLTRGSTRAHVVRAVLEGIAHRGADLLDAAVSDAASRATPDEPLHVHDLRIDGGMSVNHTFATALAEATGRTVHVSAVTEATTLGAAYLAGTALGVWKSLSAATATWRSSHSLTPTMDPTERLRTRSAWLRAVDSSKGWIPDLSALDF